jgi:hypothetical protein
MHISRSPQDNFFKPSAKKTNFSCYRPLSSSRKSGRPSVISQEDAATLRIVSDRGNPDLPDFLEFSRLGPWGAGDYRSDDGDQQYPENRTEANGNGKNIFHLTKGRGEIEGLQKQTNITEYSLGSSPQLGANPGVLMLGALQRSYKKTVIEYKPVIRSKKTSPRKPVTANMNYSRLGQVLQKYSPKHRVV